MSYIPDCRTDTIYNPNNLKTEDKHFVHGFDWCVEMAVDNFFNNLDVEITSDTYLGHLLNEEVPEDLKDEYEMNYTYVDREEDKVEKRTVKTYADLIRLKLLDWCEMQRDELIVSMIDNDVELDRDEIEKIMEEEKEG